LVIPVSLVIGILIFWFIMGDPANFQGGNRENQPIPGNFFGIIYKGGFIVPILMCLLLTVITFAIERYLTISKATGKGSVVKFVRNIQHLLRENQIEKAFEACSDQRGSVASVVQAALTKYKQVEADDHMTKEQKLLAIQKDVEESTALELPVLEQNLVILATISSIATLMGLLGTVLGMIRAFAAMANAGSPTLLPWHRVFQKRLLTQLLVLEQPPLPSSLITFLLPKSIKLLLALTKPVTALFRTMPPLINKRNEIYFLNKIQHGKNKSKKKKYLG